MKLSTFDLGRARALHHLLEEAHVGRASEILGITPAAASNALNRLRADFGDPLLVKKGRGLIRTRVGESLREPARAVIAAAVQLEQASRPFDPSTFEGQFHVALAEHVAAVLLPDLDRLVREQAPRATLAVAPIPDRPTEWLQRTGGVLVSPLGAFAAADTGDGLVSTPLYEDRYVVAMTASHPAANGPWAVEDYVAYEHLLVVTRGRTPRSDVDDQLAALGLVRRIGRIVPSFTLALPLLARSELITTMPKLYAEVAAPLTGVVLREAPLPLRPLKMFTHVDPAHNHDAAVRFTEGLLKGVVSAVQARAVQRVSEVLPSIFPEGPLLAHR